MDEIISTRSTEEIISCFCFVLPQYGGNTCRSRGHRGKRGGRLGEALEALQPRVHRLDEQLALAGGRPAGDALHCDVGPGLDAHFFLLGLEVPELEEHRRVAREAAKGDRHRDQRAQRHHPAILLTTRYKQQIRPAVRLEKSKLKSPPLSTRCLRSMLTHPSRGRPQTGLHHSFVQSGSNQGPVRVQSGSSQGPVRVELRL
eukprot:1185556-Prorocentrum_minimum.AAC.2